MQDKLTEIYNLLIEDDIIKKHTHYIDDDKEDAYRINFYVEPETADLTKPFIIIEPLSPPKDNVYGSDKALSTAFYYQIDVQSTERLVCKEIQKAIKKILEDINFYQLDGGFDEYFKETGRFIDARRYKGNSKMYDTDY